MTPDKVLQKFLEQKESIKYIKDLEIDKITMTSDHDNIWIQLVRELIDQQMRDTTVGIKGSTISNYLDNRI